jgi:2-polyprenyl-3-methyl-5-hydroxy-6-metoxy-1,4-benzoquinol methylase
MSKPRRCRFCKKPLSYTFVDLGASPPSNSFLSPDALDKMEPFYPLHAYVCDECFLVQLAHSITPDEIFREYAYFSSYSDTWLAHAKQYTEDMLDSLSINDQRFVVEIAGNDGYLLQYFKHRGIPCLNIEPALNVAEVARSKGIETITEFFGVGLADKLVSQCKGADLLIGNNVLAHVPDINDFVHGMKRLLKPTGFITMEFPHLLKLIEQNLFDTIYHEHYSYLSLHTVKRIFEKHGLSLFDVEEFPIQGGSLRIYAQHTDSGRLETSHRVERLMEIERNSGLTKIETYGAFSQRVKDTKRKFLSFLIEIKNQGKSIVGYGAPAKANTLLNYCGIRTDFLDYTVDRNPVKQGLFLPGNHIPIFHPDRIKETKPDYLIILPWNLKEEIMEQMNFISDWGGKFIVPIPEPLIY